MKTLIIIVANLAAISALFWLFDYAYRAYRLDLLRHHLFKARDDLFLAASQGIIAFDHPAYGMTRQTLNGMIRFAHELGLWRLVVLMLGRRWLEMRDDREHFWRNYNDAIKSLPLPARQRIIRSMAEAHVAVAAYLLHTSLITFPFVIGLKWAMRIAMHAKRFARVLRKSIPTPAKQSLDFHAYETGA